MVRVALRDVSVRLDGHEVLRDVGFDVDDGTFAAVVGPSGSGKTTLLRLVAGLVRQQQGQVLFDGHDVSTVEPGRRGIGMVFQAPALFPHRNVRRNVSFPLEMRRETTASIRARVDAETRAMHIEHLLLRDPGELSRGEQQMVQIARTMVRAPRVLLLDEPFAPLDAHLRRTMRAEIKLLQEGYGVTTLMATNDPDDLGLLAEQIIVLGSGPAASPGSGPADTSPSHSSPPSRSSPSSNPSAGGAGRGGTGRDGDDGGATTVVQSGSREQIAAAPFSLDVATSVGHLTTLRARIEVVSGEAWIVTPSGSVRLRSWAPTSTTRHGEEVVLGFRAGELVAQPNGGILATFERRVPGSPEPLLCRVDGRLVNAIDGAARHDHERGAPIRLGAHGWLLFDPVTRLRIG